MLRGAYYFFGVVLFVMVVVGGAGNAAAALPPDSGAAQQSCVIGKASGRATTYNPACERESTSLSTGGRYNAGGWEAALQLDLAKRFRCGYGGRCYAAVENLDNGRAAILLINDNGPLYSGSYGNKNVVIDLNEASMRYLGNDPSGARYGNCKGILPRVSVTLLCRLIGQLGPLDEQDRLAWNKIAASFPNTSLPQSALGPSPFANVSPFSGMTAPSGYPSGSYPSQSVYSPTSQQQQYIYNPATGQYELRPVSQMIQTGATSISPADGQAASSVPPAALLTVQPRTVSRGSTGLVSWSSVGMQNSAPCKVSVFSGGREVVVGQANEGSRQIKIDTNSPTGAFTFTLRCNALSGAAVQRTAELTVK